MRARCFGSRIDAPSTPDLQLDLPAIVGARPYGLMVPTLDHPPELVALSEQLRRLEAAAGIAVRTTRLIPLLESPRGILTAAGYLQSRLWRSSGINWGAEGLGVAPGVRPSHDVDGE
jgi:citrate lyase subunit beta / citryl-CoA lyase